MAELPENGIKVFEFTELFSSFDLDDVRRALEQAVVEIDTHPGSTTPVPATARSRAASVRAARSQLLAFLRHQAVTDDVPALREAYDALRRRSFGPAFGPAHEALTRVRDHPGLSAVTEQTVELSYAGPVSFPAVIHGPRDAEGIPTPIRVTRVILRGYDGPQVPAADIIALNSFMRAGAERKRLLDNECLQGLGGPDHLVQAIHGYARLLPPSVTDQVDVLGVRINLFRRYVQRHKGPQQAVMMPGIFVTWAGAPRDITPAQQFAALRSAFAHLALADHLFRQHRVVTGTDRSRLGDVYAAATRLVVDSGISPENALRGQIEAHAARQRRKLTAQLNALGLWDGFVPVLRFSALARAADTAIRELAESAGKALESLRAAEVLIGEELELVQEATEEDLRTGIYLSKLGIAKLEEDKMDEQVSMIEDQRAALLAQTAAGLISRIASANPEQMVGVAVSGIIEAGVTFSARSTELGHQLDMARLDVDIAGAQREIARTEMYLSERRKEHLAQRLDFLVNRQVDADLYQTLADLHEARAARVLEAAILLAYLAERSLAFARGEDLPPIIRFDYWADPTPQPVTDPEELTPVARLNTAAASLQSDFADLSRLELVMEDDNLQTFQEHISLSEQYPLELARLLQDGETHFEYSLYQLSKRFPFTHKCRLYGAAVEVHALGPSGGPRGILEHTGTFLVRQRDATLGQATRLIPADAELTQAVRRQRAEGRGVAAVGGVLYYVLEPDPLVSTLNTALLPVNAPDDLLPEDLRRALEGYGPAGLWRLELHNLDELRITDITIHFGLVAGVDTGRLEERIEQLVGEYEAELAQDGEPLDKITRFSLRQQFPDAFADLRTGTATVPLERSVFPDGLANLQFKALVAQALDADDRGLENIPLRFGRPDAAFRRERVTVRGGFSEDLDVEPEILPRADRFPVDGQWQIELVDPGQFAQLGDLRLFVMYSYE